MWAGLSFAQASPFKQPTPNLIQTAALNTDRHTTWAEVRLLRLSINARPQVSADTSKYHRKDNDDVMTFDVISLNFFSTIQTHQTLWTPTSSTVWDSNLAWCQKTTLVLRLVIGYVLNSCLCYLFLLSDYYLIRKGGLIFAGVLFLVGIAILFSKFRRPAHTRLLTKCLWVIFQSSADCGDMAATARGGNVFMFSVMGGDLRDNC